MRLKSLSYAVVLLSLALSPNRATGERELAIKNYKKSLELNPQNTNATTVLKRLGQ